MANQVTLTFAGEEKPLTDSFDRVGSSAKKMGDDAGSAARGLDEHANGLAKVGESADNTERSVIGVHDIIDGTATIMQGPGKQGIVAYLQGWADLAGGIAPMFEMLSKTRAATLAQAAASKVAALGTNIWTGAQRLLSLAFISSPVGWIVLAIGALIAVIVLIATKTDWFQKAWRNSWKWIKNAASDTWDFLKKIPGWIASAFSKVANFILTPYKAAFNGIARAWNATVGRLSWSVPSWVPFIGGNTISVPNLPTFHAGGIVGGVPGTPTVALLQAGEKVSSIASSGGSDGFTPLQATDRFGDAVLQLVASAVSRAGGTGRVLGLQRI